MKSRIVLTLLSTGTLVAQSPPGQLTTIGLASDQITERAWIGDVSGDGHNDLVIAAHEQGKSYLRHLQVHYRREGTATPFAQTPDLILALPNTVTAVGVGDVYPDPGSEIVWFGARGVYVWRPQAEESERVVKIVDSSFLFQFPHPTRVFSWQNGIHDLDDDGLHDLVLPEKDGYRIAVQRRNATGTPGFVVSTLRIPPTQPDAQTSRPASVRGNGQAGPDQFRLPGFGIEPPRAPLVSIAQDVPAPRTRDFDGDGDLDLIVRRGSELLVWLQGAGGEFSEQPDDEFDFPFTSEQTQLDFSFRALLTDFDLDSLSDVVLFTKDRGTDDIRTQILFFPQAAGDGKRLFAEGVPQQLLVLAGISTLPRITDVDGDGTPDLHVGSFRLDVLEQLTSAGDRTLDVDVYIYFNRSGRFSRRPDLTHKITLQGDLLNSDNNRLFGRFIGDATGDGISDLLVRDRAQRMQLFMVRKSRTNWSTVPRPVREFAIEETADIQHFPDDAPRCGFLILERRRVTLVEF